MPGSLLTAMHSLDSWQTFCYDSVTGRMCIWQYKSRSWQSYSSDRKLARRIERLMTKLDCRFKTVHRERGTCRRQPHVRPLTTVPPSAAIQPGATSSFRQTMHQWSVGKDELNLGFASHTDFRHNIREQVAVSNSQRVGVAGMKSVLQ